MKGPRDKHKGRQRQRQAKQAAREAKLEAVGGKTIEKAPSSSVRSDKDYPAFTMAGTRSQQLYNLKLKYN